MRLSEEETQLWKCVTFAFCFSPGRFKLVWVSVSDSESEMNAQCLNILTPHTVALFSQHDAQRHWGPTQLSVQITLTPLLVHPAALLGGAGSYHFCPVSVYFHNSALNRQIHNQWWLHTPRDLRVTTVMAKPIHISSRPAPPFTAHVVPL